MDSPPLIAQYYKRLRSAAIKGDLKYGTTFPARHKYPSDAESLRDLLLIFRELQKVLGVYGAAGGPCQVMLGLYPLPRSPVAPMSSTT
jgi:hypothetical protein